ncbi:MAG: lysylphosphatidylglycerol synthase transmembrane domain-containing protein [Lentisphaerota bacterium]
MNPKIKSVLWLLLKILLAAGIIGGMIYVKRADLRKAVQNINYLWILPAVLLYAVHVLAGVWRWYLLLRVQKIMISFKEALSLNMQGLFFTLTPLGFIGGDLAKAGFISSRAEKGLKMKGVFTILIDRILGMIALFTLVGVVGALSLGFLRSLSGGLELVLYAIIAACIIAAASVVLLFFHRSLEKISILSLIINTCDKYSKGALHNLMNAMDEFKSHYKTLIFCILISIVLVHLNLALILYFIGLGTGAENISFKLSVLVVSIGNTAGTLPLTPSGFGTRDIVIQNILSAGGIKEQATLIPLILSCMILAFNLSGGLFFIFSRKKSKKDNSKETA